jgi:hypothetical protein
MEYQASKFVCSVKLLKFRQQLIVGPIIQIDYCKLRVITHSAVDTPDCGGTLALRRHCPPDYLLCLAASVPKFAGSNPAEAVGFFRAKKNPQRAFLRKGSKTVGPMSLIYGM